jgi:hypothetical protein
LLLKLKSEGTSIDMIIGVIMFSVLFGYLILCVIVIKKYKATLKTKKVSSKISNLYQDVRLKDKSYWNLMYYPIFLFRRIVFVAIPTFLHKHSYFQIQLLVLLTSFYIMYYCGTRPHLTGQRVKIEVFNEVIIMLMNYHMVCLSEFNLSIEMHFHVGYSMVAWIVLMVAVNLSAMAFRIY